MTEDDEVYIIRDPIPEEFVQEPTIYRIKNGEATPIFRVKDYHYALCAKDNSIYFYDCRSNQIYAMHLSSGKKRIVHKDLDFEITTYNTSMDAFEGYCYDDDREHVYFKITNSDIHLPMDECVYYPFYYPKKLSFILSPEIYEDITKVYMVDKANGDILHDFTISTVDWENLIGYYGYMDELYLLYNRDNQIKIDVVSLCGNPMQRYTIDIFAEKDDHIYGCCLTNGFAYIVSNKTICF